MRFDVGTRVKVTHCYSGAEFRDGEIVTIVGIGFEDDTNCYECVNKNDPWHWYLYEDEVEPITNGDKIRSMNDEELAEFLHSFKCGKCRQYGNSCFPGDLEDWLKRKSKNENLYH